jgi:hypothetical protein
VRSLASVISTCRIASAERRSASVTSCMPISRDSAALSSTSKRCRNVSLPTTSSAIVRTPSSSSPEPNV